jgi:hypothetical protein
MVFLSNRNPASMSTQAVRFPFIRGSSILSISTATCSSKVFGLSLRAKVAKRDIYKCCQMPQQIFRLKDYQSARIYNRTYAAILNIAIVVR